MHAVKEFFARHFGAQGVERVLSVEDRFNGASALSAHALTMFDDVLHDLEEANVDLDTVEAQSAAEIARLTELAQAAARQRGQNAAVAANVRRLLTPPAEENPPQF